MFSRFRWIEIRRSKFVFISSIWLGLHRLRKRRYNVYHVFFLSINLIQNNTQWDLTLFFLTLKFYKLQLKSICTGCFLVALNCNTNCLHQGRYSSFFTLWSYNQYPWWNLGHEVHAFQEHLNGNWDYIIIVVEMSVFL